MSTPANSSSLSSARPSIRIRAAALAEDSAIMHLINAAFVVERVAFDGDRIDREGVQLLLSKGTFLIAEPSDASSPCAPDPVGCVYLEPQGDRCYLGLLSVAPAMQSRGIGRQLALAAEDFARQAGCTAIDLRIISPRAHDLLPLYARLGYIEAGTSPIPDEGQSKIPCHYIAMTKALA
jgi:GNAT superfamily N-acetyltransferase